MHFDGINATNLLECAQDSGSIFAKDPVLLLVVLMMRHKTPCVAQNGINCYWMAGQMWYEL